MDPVRPPSSDLHGGLVGVAVAGAASWLALSASLLDWAWDGALLGRRVSAGGALVMSCALAGLAAGVVGAMVGMIKGRHVRWSVLAGVGAAQVAAVALAGAMVLVLAFAGASVLAPTTPWTFGGAALLSAASVGAVLLTPRRQL